MTTPGEFYERLWDGPDADRENAWRWEFQRVLVARAVGWLGEVRDRVVLEIGPGPGREAAELVAAGARVVVVDLAHSALLRTRVATAGRALGLQARAERLPLADGSVDRIFTQTVLMHLDLPVAAAEWRRVLCPGGRVVILEPLAGNPLVGLYRRFLSPYRETAPTYLRLATLARLDPGLALVRHEEHYLLAVLAMVAPPAVGRWLQRPLTAVDRILLRVPGLNRLGWMTLAELEKPRG